MSMNIFKKAALYSGVAISSIAYTGCGDKGKEPEPTKIDVNAVVASMVDQEIGFRVDFDQNADNISFISGQKGTNASNPSGNGTFDFIFTDATANATNRVKPVNIVSAKDRDDGTIEIEASGFSAFEVNLNQHKMYKNVMANIKTGKTVTFLMTRAWHENVDKMNFRTPEDLTPDAKIKLSDNLTIDITNAEKRGVKNITIAKN